MQNAEPLIARRGLRELADVHGKRIGTAVNTNLLASDAAYAALLAHEFSSVTPENVMKWALVEPQRGVFDYLEVNNAERSTRLGGIGAS
jgi:endo-1,4-beta-xylanase